MSAETLAYIQARIFRKSSQRRFYPEDFIKGFMRWSAKELDRAGCSPDHAKTICDGFLDVYRNPADSRLAQALLPDRA